MPRGSSSPANRLGFALALCAVRYLGFCPENLAAAPKNAAWYVGQQLMVPTEALEGYPEREQTTTDHLEGRRGRSGRTCSWVDFPY